MNSKKINASKCKHFIDILLSIFILLFLSPLFLVVALLILAESRGGAIYRQKRVGLNGKRFYLYKFRTMVVDAEQQKHALLELHKMSGPVFKVKNDPRVTQFGKFLRRTSLDELPQFFNVLKGDMSIVGPRPHIQAEVDLYTEEQRERLQIKPGITCIWQVSGRHKHSFEKWMELDLEYIRTWSCWGDVFLILRTIWVVFQGEGY